MKTLTIVILNDGETYSAMDGCEILTINAEAKFTLTDGLPENIPKEHILSSMILTAPPIL